MFVKDEELIVYNKWFCKWGERTEERRQKGGVSYSPPQWTLHVSTPAWLSRSLLWPSIPSIGSSTFVLMESHSGTRSS